MGKRLYRIFEKEIPTKIHPLKSREINVVLKNNKTFLGILMEFGKDSITIKDPRKELHTFKYSDISEIIYDGEAAY